MSGPKTGSRPVVGTGGPLVQFIVETLHGYGKTVAEAKLLALYALKAAKEYDPYSGKDTRLKTLRGDGKIETAGQTEIRHAEDYFGEIFESIKVALTILGLPDMGDEEIELAQEAFKNALIQFREHERQRKEQERRKLR